MLHQVRIGTAEMLVPEKAIVSRKGRWVDGSKYQMLAPVYESPFLLRIRTP